MARFAALFAVAVADKCCEGSCELPLRKYHSVDVPHGFCGEACMDPKKFFIYKLFEKNLTLSDMDSPCPAEYTPNGTRYTEYTETVTHGIPGLLSVTLDLYGPTTFAAPAPVPVAVADKCCEGSCELPLKKYHSVDVPHGFCGEACMDPKKFFIYKLFEKNLTLSDTESPCPREYTPNGTLYTEYTETVTHGIPGLLSVTLDLYGPSAPVPRPVLTTTPAPVVGGSKTEIVV